MQSVAFHLAIGVFDLEETRRFYQDVLGCKVGRTCQKWIDFDFFGHQVTAHLGDVSTNAIRNEVDRKSIPVPHFGCVLFWQDFLRLEEKLTAMKTVFEVKPYLRFAGEVGEQKTMFLRDPSGHYLEFKAFKNPESLFDRG